MSVWTNNKKFAISLTYDDALPEHLQAVPEALERRGFRGTFYIHGKSENLAHNPDGFRALSARGHELGNHSLFHPCRKNMPGREWVADHYDLSRYDPQRIREELRIQNLLLHLLDNQEKRSYGATCGDLELANGEDMVPHIEDMFTVIRGGGQHPHWVPGNPLPKVVPCSGGDGKTAAQLLAQVEALAQTGGWQVFIFHGVGNAHHSLFIDEAEHEKFLDGLSRYTEAFVAPVSEVMGILKASLSI